MIKHMIIWKIKEDCENPEEVKKRLATRQKDYSEEIMYSEDE